MYLLVADTYNCRQAIATCVACYSDMASFQQAHHNWFEDSMWVLEVTQIVSYKLLSRLQSSWIKLDSRAKTPRWVLKFGKCFRCFGSGKWCHYSWPNFSAYLVISTKVSKLSLLRQTLALNVYALCFYLLFKCAAVRIELQHVGRHKLPLNDNICPFVTQVADHCCKAHCMIMLLEWARCRISLSKWRVTCWNWILTLVCVNNS